MRCTTYRFSAVKGHFCSFKISRKYHYSSESELMGQPFEKGNLIEKKLRLGGPCFLFEEKLQQTAQHKRTWQAMCEKF